jgi:hypothetical protein
VNNLPHGAELLLMARETLLSEIRPLLEGDARYTLAMIANAMAIAAREAQAGDAPVHAALARLDALYGRPSAGLAGAQLREALLEGERNLAQDIRAGCFDEKNERQRALIEHLRESVAARLRISNPKSLPHPNPSPGGRRAASESTPLPPGEGPFSDRTPRADVRTPLPPGEG